MWVVRILAAPLLALAAALSLDCAAAPFTVRLGLEDPRIHALILGYWHTIITPPMVFAKLMVEVVDDMRAQGIEKPVVASLAGDVEVEEAAEYLYQHGIPAYAYSTEIPVAVLGAKYKWARGAGLISAT